jgi:UDP-N-acetylmuramate-alanine ligase
LSKTIDEALVHTLTAVDIPPPKKGILISLGTAESKGRFLKRISAFETLVAPLYATPGTAELFEQEKIISSIEKFKGMKRRLEKRYDGDIKVIDDIAHSGEKAISVLNCLRSIYKGKIIMVFEPNIGGREIDASGSYKNAFIDSDIVIIPRLSKLKINENEDKKPMDGKELAGVISNTHKNTLYIEDDEELINFLLSNTKKGDTIAFLGSHGFRGMIEETVKRLGK